ncbi:MAG TPA: hypothetical protein VGF08_03190 [Terriglobales bacterium]
MSEQENLGQLSSQNPWPGLRAFTESDREFFFGRERETAELLGLVQLSPVTVLYGQSGLGKTSLVQAGIFPELKRLNFLPFRLRLDHSDEAPPLAAQLKEKLNGEMDKFQVSAPRPSPEESLWEYFHRRDVDFWGLRNRLLVPIVVLDQFEEVFTLGQKNEATIARVEQFAAELEALLEHHPPEAVRDRLENHPDDSLHFDFQRQNIKLVFSLREDFLPHLDTWRSRMPSLLSNRFRLERMTGAQALDVVVRAGQNLVEPAVARDVVDFVSSSQRRRAARLTEQREVEPALLSVVCDELNRRRMDKGQESITADLLTHEREGIIQSFYDRAFEDIDPRVRNWVEDELLTASGYRDRAAMEDALKLGFPEDAFDLLVDRRILHREEREGVLWLELTHDLLTDPAAQSRTLREQRRQADAASHLRRELHRAQRRNVVYAGLLVVAVLGFGSAYLKQRQLRIQEQRLQQQQASKEQALDAAAEATRSMGLDVAGDLWVPTSIVLHTINKVERSYTMLSGEELASEKIREQHAEFLAKAALALLEVGHFEEAIKSARDALQGFDQLKDPSIAAEVGLGRAEAFYAHGKGLLETGQLAEARQDFDSARRLTADSGKTESQQDRQRIQVLSMIGLGEVEQRAYAFDKAIAHFQDALDFIARRRNFGPESVSWKARALAGIGLSQTDDVEQERWLAQANRTLGGLDVIRKNNLQQKRIFAEITYQQEFNASRLDKRAEEEQFNLQSNTASLELSERDPENLDWQLSLAQARRGAGMIHLARGEWDLAPEGLEAAEKIAHTLTDAQPNWTQAQFLRGAALFSMGNLIQRKYANWPADWRSAKDLDRALERLSEAQKWLEHSAERSPKTISLLASSIAYQGLVYEDQASVDGVSPEIAKGKRAAALQSYRRAREVLKPVEEVQQADVASYDQWTGNLLLDQNRFAAAIASFQEAVRVREQMVRKSPNPGNYSGLSKARESLGYAYKKSEKYAAADAQYALATQAIDTGIKLREQTCPHMRCTHSSSDIDLVRQQSDVQAAIHDLRNSQSDPAGAVQALDRAVTIVWTALEQDYANGSLTGDLGRYRRVATKDKEELQNSQGQAADSGGEKKSGAGNSSDQTGKLIAKLDEVLERSNPQDLLKHNDQTSWVLPPIVPGAWRTLSSGELEDARKQLLGVDKRFTATQIHGIRKLPVDFYEDAALYEAQVPLPDGNPGILAYIRRRGKVTVLDGWWNRILDLTREAPPRLDTTQRAIAYVRFALAALQNENGRFVLVEQPEDIHWQPDVKAQRREETAKKIRPLIIESLPDGSWQGIGTWQISSGNLVVASFHLSRVGFVDIQQDETETVARNLPVVIEGFNHGIRGPFTKEMGLETVAQQVTTSPKDPDALKKYADMAGELKQWHERGDALQKLTAVYAEQKKWKDAAESQQSLVDLIQSTGSDQDRRQKLPEAYTSLAWYQLRAGDFKSALVSAESGGKLDSSSAKLQEYRAHALMFLDRKDEAGPIYQQLAKGAQDREVLQDLVELSSQHGWYDQRAEAQKQLVNLVRTGTEKKDLPAGYADLSLYELWAGDFDSALASADQGLQTNSPERAVQRRLQAYRADALLLLGRKADAETIYRKLETGNSDPGALKELLAICAQNERWDERIFAEQRIVNLLERIPTKDSDTRSKLVSDYGNLAWYQLMLGRFSDGLSSAESGKKYTSSSQNLDSMRADALLFLGRTQEADAIYRTLEGTSSWKLVLQDLVTLSDRNDRYKERAEAQQKLVSVLDRSTREEKERRSTLPKEYSKLAWYQLWIGDLKAALATVEAGRKLDADYLDFDEEQAHALQLMGRTQEADVLYTRLEKDSSWPSRLKDLVSLYEQMDRYKERAEYQEKLVVVLESKPSDDPSRRKLYEEYANLAWDRLWIGDFAGALAAAEAGRKFNDSYLPFIEYRADALVFLGREQDAEPLDKQLATTSRWKRALERRVSVARENKRWKQAVNAEQQVVALVGQQAKTEQERRENLPGEYTSLSWYQIFAQDFAGALNSCEAGSKWNSTYLPLQTNCAHALMFLGRLTEAEQIYLKYRGQKVFAGSDKLWEQVVLQDFDDLQAGGLDNPEIGKVRKLLSTQSAAATATQN